MKQTSLNSFKSVATSKLQQQDKIIKAMKRMYKKKGDYYKIAKYSGLEPVQVHRRLHELVALGKISETNELSLSPSNRPCTVYVLNKEAA